MLINLLPLAFIGVFFPVPECRWTEAGIGHPGAGKDFAGDADLVE